MEAVDIEKAITKVLNSLPPIVVPPEPAKADAVARREMFTSLVSACMRDEGHIMSLHSTYTQRVKQTQEEQTQAGLLVEMATIKQIPDGVKLDLIARGTDIQADDTS